MIFRRFDRNFRVFYVVKFFKNEVTTIREQLSCVDIAKIERPNCYRCISLVRSPDVSCVPFGHDVLFVLPGSKHVMPQK